MRVSTRTLARTVGSAAIAGVRFPAVLLVSAPNHVSVGGQAVMEGVMMRGPHHWSLAVRRYTGDIADLHREFNAYGIRHRWARLPVVRGIVALGESLTIGFRALSVSAYYAAEEAYLDEDAGKKVDDEPALVDGHHHNGHEHHAGIASGTIVPVEVTPAADTPESLSGWQIAIAFIFAIGFSIAVFKLGPLFLARHVLGRTSGASFVLVEGAIRVAVLIVYMALIGLVPDLRRLFKYHSAEHKAINAWENGVALEPELVNAQSRIHVRCGTAFLLWVMVVAILVFGVFAYIVGKASILTLVLSRILLLPIIAGMSFELIKFAGRYPNNPLLRGILSPGLKLQLLTTRECEPEHCEVAIRALEIVLEHEGLTEAERAESGEAEEPVEVMA